MGFNRSTYLFCGAIDDGGWQTASKAYYLHLKWEAEQSKLKITTTVSQTLIMAKKDRLLIVHKEGIKNLN